MDKLDKSSSNVYKYKFIMFAFTFLFNSTPSMIAVQVIKCCLVDVAWMGIDYNVLYTPYCLTL